MICMRRESREPYRFPADHRSESRLSIPRRGALQRSSSPLPQPPSILKRTVEFVERFLANGECLIFGPSHFWGAPQTFVGAVRSGTRLCTRKLPAGGRNGQE